jgi:hypothetical protein
MKTFNFKALFIFAALLTTLASCTNVHKSMREPNVLVELDKADFTLSDQVSAEASSTKILNIDWARLFKQKEANVNSSFSINLSSIPVIGTIAIDKTSNYALYELMQANPGYDVVFYPQYETTVQRPILFGFIYKKTTVKATARLGKLNK